MKNTKKTKKNKRSSAPKSTCKNVAEKKDDGKGAGRGIEAEEEQNLKVLEGLVGAFSLSSLEEAALAYRDAEGDPDIAAKTMRRGYMDTAEDHSTCSTSSGVSGLDLASTSGSSEAFMESNCAQDMTSRTTGFRRGKQKKVLAATGTVSTVLGKEYVRRNSTRPQGYYSNGIVGKEEAEQFLCSMLGNDCDVGFDVVRDVLCQCGYDIEKALDVLLDLSVTSYQQSRNDSYPDDMADNIDDMRFLAHHSDNLTDSRSEGTSFSSEGELSDNLWSLGSFSRNYADVLSGSKAQSPNSCRIVKSDLPQKVLESLFKIPQSTEHDKDAMNWRNIVKKMQSLGPEFNVCLGVAESHQHSHAKGDDYYVIREDAKQHWDSMRTYYQKAAGAYTKKDRAYAAYLSDQGKEQNKLAQKADSKASHDIFIARNKDIENVITIDLHGQHVKPAMRMLKLHLLFGSYIPSVQTLKVITGCGSHGVGKSKLKQSVIQLLEKEAIEWREENRGTVMIKLNGYRDFSFLGYDSDSDSN